MLCTNTAVLVSMSSSFANVLFVCVSRHDSDAVT